MKNIMILTVSLVMPIASYSKPLKSLIQNKPSQSVSCASIRGNWTGDCTEKDGDETRTYQSNYRVLQDGCYSLQLIEGEIGAETYQTGRTNMTQHTEWGTFFNITSYVNWSDPGSFNAKDYYSGEFSFESDRRIVTGSREMKIKVLGGGNISFSQTESSSSSKRDESDLNAYTSSIECAYKVTR